MKNFLIFITVLGLFSNVYAAPDSNTAQDFVQENAINILSDLINGIYEGDYIKFSENFSGILKESFDRESFLKLQKSVQKTLGKIESAKYLGFYKQLGGTIVLFKAKFTKEKDDVLIKLVLDGSGTNMKISGFWLDTPALEK